MRISPLLLAAIALLLVSSGMTVKVSAGRCKRPNSVILYPGKPCNPQVCKKTCASQYKNGVGTCMNPDGCDCEFCLGLSTPSTRNGMK
ncbi:hypothetical protein PVAP13_1KG112022 [Panicum virgatum]|uniref:Uncharacterized protein n=1 Tax=Panicum virgatum TaxID=38727 RepID=A0A8T0XKG6_PANVG|nr:hypothetical protein PVAP13_1KG112022 [Panicum virgatum]